VATITVSLKDGRRIDITGLSPARAIAKLRASGALPDDIKHTEHRIQPGESGDAVVKHAEALEAEATRQRWGWPS
jgi:hypothetical protein